MYEKDPRETTGNGQQHPVGGPVPQRPVPNTQVPPAWGPPSMPPFPPTPTWHAAPSPGAGALYAPTASLPAPARSQRTGRLRIGMAGLVAGALIGGGAGAGVVTLTDDGSSGGTAPVAAQPVTITNPENATAVTAAAATASPSVVTVYVSSGSAGGSGSGVVLTDDGYVLTNNHVVSIEGNSSANVQVRTSDGTIYAATIVGTEPGADLAVLKLDGAGGLTAATFADSDEVQVGDLAVAIGAPLGLTDTVTDGIISATDRAVATGSTQSDATVLDALQTDAAINPGNSGGALVNGAGEVIGINTAIATVASGAPGSGRSGSIGVGFAIPSRTAERIATEIIADGSADMPLLGVSARTAADEDNAGIGTGAGVMQLEPGSAAAEAGLRPGDVITAVGDRLVTTSTELTAAVRSYAPGDEVTLTVVRDGDTSTVDVTLAVAAG